VIVKKKQIFFFIIIFLGFNFYIVVSHDAQRTGLCAGWELEFRLPETAAD